MDLFNSRRAFTLLELMIVIAILGVLASLISGNFLTSLTKGRDARRKADLENVAQALELYYEDKRAYPESLDFGQPLCETEDCVNGERVYMQELPTDPKNSNNYFYQSDDGTSYNLFACIENANDQGKNVAQGGYPNTNCGACGGTGTLCKYVITSANLATPEPNPTPN